MDSESLLVRCKAAVVVFVQGSGRNTQWLRHTDCGGSDYLTVSRTEDELRIRYIRDGAGKTPQAIQTVCWNFKHVLEYTCE